MITKTIFSAIVVICALGCAREKTAKHEDIIRITSRGTLTNAAVLIADEEGDFAREGIRLQYEDSPRSSMQLIPLLERRALDVIASSPGAGFYAAVAKGAQSRMVADRGHVEPNRCDYNGIMGSRTAFTTDTPTAAQMKGKKFSINTPGAATLITDKYLESLGLDESDVQVVKLSENLEMQAMDAGSLDAMHATEPWVSRLKAAGHRMLASGASIAPGAHFATLMYGPSLTVDNRALGVRFMKGYLRGVRRFAQGPTARNIEILVRRTGFDAKVLQTACLPAISVNGTLNIPWLLEFQEWAVEKGHLNEVLSADAGLDTTFARDAAAQLDATAKQ